MTKQLKIKAFNFLQKAVGAFGLQLVRKEADLRRRTEELPAEARAYLVSDNAKLKRLLNRYFKLDGNLTNSSTWNWSERPMSTYLLQNFRSDSMYVWQFRGLDNVEMRYTITTYYLLRNDSLRLFEKLKDDALFGNNLFEVGGYKVSREILDAISEINFLERHLKLSTKQDLRILDIGSGYGRLAHRIMQVFDNNISAYYCTDAVPYSLFICDYYLQYRGLKKQKILEMPNVEKELTPSKVNLALNIHSFSECTLESIDWWLDQLEKASVQYLMVAPNSGRDHGNRLHTNDGSDFTEIILRHGYTLIVKEPKYNDPAIQRTGLFPTHYYLFERL